MMPRVPMDDQYPQSTTASSGSGSGSGSGNHLNHGGHISSIHQPTTMNHPQGQVNIIVQCTRSTIILFFIFSHQALTLPSSLTPIELILGDQSNSNWQHCFAASLTTMAEVAGSLAVSISRARVLRRLTKHDSAWVLASTRSPRPTLVPTLTTTTAIMLHLYDRTHVRRPRPCTRLEFRGRCGRRPPVAWMNSKDPLDLVLIAQVCLQLYQILKLPFNVLILLVFCNVI